VRFGPFIKLFFSALLFLIATYLALSYRSDMKEIFTGRTDGVREEVFPREAQPFFDALVGDKLDDVRTALDHDPSLLKIQLPNGDTGLHVAVSHGRAQAAALLLDRGAELESPGEWGGTPLHWACLTGNPECVDLLIKRGAKIEARCVAFDSTPMLWAAHGSQSEPAREKQYEQICEQLFNAGASCDTMNRSGIPAVQLASPGVAKFLRDHGAHDAPTAAHDSPTSVEDPFKAHT
jgi:Ankyrin repeats (3 copies)